MTMSMNTSLRINMNMNMNMANVGFHSHTSMLSPAAFTTQTQFQLLFISPFPSIYHLNSSFNLKRRCKFNLLPQIRAQTTPDYVPDSKFYKVEAILRPWRVPKVSSALLNMGIRGVTVSDVRGFGAQGGSTERHAGSEFSEDKFVTKVKMEIVISKDQVESVIDLITQEARTGEIGDGKIFVMPVAEVIRVRTGERGAEADRMSGGWHDMSNGSKPR